VCANDDHDGTSELAEVTVANRGTGTLHSEVANDDEGSIGNTDRATLDLLIFVDPFYDDEPRGLHRVDITGTLHLVDDDWWDETETVKISDTVTLHENQRFSAWSYQRCVGDEVVGRVEANFILSPDGTVDVDSHYHLYEGTDCARSQGEDGEDRDFVLAVDDSETVAVDLSNNGDDKAEFDLTFEHRSVE
jgi:hypothetical protein